MIDTVAKALHNVMARQAPGPRRYWEMAPPEVRYFARALARASIEAMREPPEDILAECTDAYGEAIGTGKDFWQRMIDAAIAEPADD